MGKDGKLTGYAGGLERKRALPSWRPAYRSLLSLSDLDAAIQAFFDATNAADSDAFVAAFADDAVLIDWGREFHGHAEIARWNANENIGVQSQIDGHRLRAQRERLDRSSASR